MVGDGGDDDDDAPPPKYTDVAAYDADPPQYCKGWLPHFAYVC